MMYVRTFTTAAAASVMCAVPLSPIVDKIVYDEAQEEHCRENAEPVRNKLTRRSGDRVG